MPYLDLDNWARRAQYEFFRQFKEPCWSITATVDITAIREQCRQDEELSFAAAYHYVALRAANEIESMRLRIDGDRVLIHDRLDGGTTVLLPDDTFTFCHFPYDEDFWTFRQGLRERFEEAREGKVPFAAFDDRTDLIRFTSIPWVRFTALQHAIGQLRDDSVPKIAFGKCYEEAMHFMLPVSVEVHHALVDGLHVGQFFDRMERLAGSEL